jgi:hypothetical protein
MERGSFQGVAAGLEQIMENSYFDLREAMDQFQELCLMVTPERDLPVDFITDIRQTYKKIQEQLTKIRGAKQLLEGKYRQYYRRGHQREREITEIGYLAKSLYLTFEYTLNGIEAKTRLRERGELFELYRQRMPFPWFHSKGSQIFLLRNLRNLSKLDYKNQSDLEFKQRREVIWNGMRSISLFALSGEVPLIDHLQSRIRLREYDITERYKEDEVRGALTHLREISSPEVERIIRRFMDSSDFLKLKCLLHRIQSQKDLGKETVASTDDVLEVMGMGEVRIL